MPLDACTRVFRGQEPRELGEGYLAAHERNTPSGSKSLPSTQVVLRPTEAKPFTRSGHAAGWTLSARCTLVGNAAEEFA